MVRKYWMSGGTADILDHLPNVEYVALTIRHNTSLGHVNGSVIAQHFDELS